eukprot:543657-Rhodomonas_salina.1
MRHAFACCSYCSRHHLDTRSGLSRTQAAGELQASHHCPSHGASLIVGGPSRRSLHPGALCQPHPSLLSPAPDPPQAQAHPILRSLTLTLPQAHSPSPSPSGPHRDPHPHSHPHPHPHPHPHLTRTLIHWHPHPHPHSANLKLITNLCESLASQARNFKLNDTVTVTAALGSLAAAARAGPGLTGVTVSDLRLSEPTDLVKGPMGQWPGLCPVCWLQSVTA